MIVPAAFITAGDGGIVVSYFTGRGAGISLPALHRWIPAPGSAPARTVPPDRPSPMSAPAISRFDRLFNARGIAIIGASDDPGRPGSQPIAALKREGYAGGIYPVNPRYGTVAGYRCYASPADIDGPVDIAVIALPAAAAVEMVKTCGECGIGYAVVLGGGFREVGPAGLALQQQLVANARAHGLRIIGPNCNGIANIHSRMYACFGSMSRPPQLNAGPVSLVLQSGGFGYGLALTGHAQDIGFRMLIASGNEADLTAPELIDVLIEDPATEIIVAYLEGVGDGPALLAAADRALAAGKPLLVWKAGKGEQGVRAAASHTANMTGSWDVWKAAFRQHGIIDLTEMEQVTDCIKAFAGKRYPRGRNIAVLTPSGGTAVVIADAADRYGLQLPAPAEATAERIARAVPRAHTRRNPLDLGGGGISQAQRANFAETVNALIDDPDMHQIMLMTPTALGERAKTGAEIMAEASGRSDKPLFIFTTIAPELVPEPMAICAAANIPVLPSPVRVARAAATLCDWSEARAALARRQAWQPRRIGALAALQGATPGAVLDEARSKAVLAQAGIPVTRDWTLPPGGGAIPADLRYPVAVKILSPDIAHKTEVGGVLLGIADAGALQAAIRTVVDNARRARPAARIEGVLVAEMITDAVEVIVGVTHDEVFGPVLLLGMGGILAEALHDVSYRVAPVDRDTALAMIGELRSARVFGGVRGRPPCDTAALAEVLMTISSLAHEQRGVIREIEINPLMVRPQGRGVIAADALVVMHPGGSIQPEQP